MHRNTRSSNQDWTTFQENGGDFLADLNESLELYLTTNVMEIPNTHEILTSLIHNGPAVFQGPLSNAEIVFLIAARTICGAREAATILGTIITGRNSKKYGGKLNIIKC